MSAPGSPPLGPSDRPRPLAGWLLGWAITLVSLVLFPLRILRLPVEWIAGTRIERTDQGLTILTPASSLDGDAFLFVLLSLGALAGIWVLAACLGRLVGAGWRWSLAASAIALLLSAYAFLPLFDLLFRLLAGVRWFADLRFSPGFVFELHFAALTAFLAQGRFGGRSWLALAAGYALTLGVGLIVQNAIPGVSGGAYVREVLRSPLPWLNLSVCLHPSLVPSWGILARHWRAHTGFRLALLATLSLNALTVVAALLWPVLD